MRSVGDDPLCVALSHMRLGAGPLGSGRRSESSMSSCERDVQVGPYHDGELSDADRAAFEAHLAGCPACARHLAGLRGLSRRLEPARELALPESQRRRLLDMAEAVARGGVSPAADGPAAAVTDNPDVSDGSDDDDGRMRIGPASATVRWVKWMTAAAAAVFLFSVLQLFLARPTGPGRAPSLPGGTTPAIQRSTTAPIEDGASKKPAEKPEPAQPESEGGSQP